MSKYKYRSEKDMTTEDPDEIRKKNKPSRTGKLERDGRMSTTYPQSNKGWASTDLQSFNTENGFNKWWKLNPKIDEHEAKYDPVLREHVVKIKMGNKYSISYLSPKIQNEFIKLLGGAVRRTIVDKIKQAKYFCIIFDSTPDISHKDQTSQISRHVVIDGSEVKVVESFIDFVETKRKTAGEITNMILTKLENDGLDIKDCRGQAYDNAAVMAGKHSSIQTDLSN
ncbi:uncharacterized protein LOC113390967 [Ctenocephalides felis]|uniref:uncharacterized protein LOC113390963 n=1 Tax=Ctenocephalides felis TaxID=7515 RepID=UPI000E6E10D3|nr:uncharacterized protein LOC113390963 [Ctenocephalides felis]XP_026482742.1 uncharacterized protein LOC113390967 [Ctenocephalides felis]